MRLVVKGSCKSVSTTETKFLVSWLAKKLVTPRLLANLSVKLIYDPVLDDTSYEVYKAKETIDIGYFTLDAAEAFALKMGPDHKVRKTEKCRGFFAVESKIDDPPRLFRIQISPSMLRPKTIKSIAHEMVHVYQYSSGKAIHRIAFTLWDRRRRIMRDTDYRKLPWEIEAARQEGLLYEEYRNHLREHRIDGLL